MAAGSTYTPIATTTLGAPSASVTFSSISGSYTDLIIQGSFATVAANYDLRIQFNSDTGTNYSYTYLLGNGSAAGSGRGTNTNQIQSYFSVGTSTNPQPMQLQIPSYSKTTTNKTCLLRIGSADKELNAIAGLWRSTAAITSVTIFLNSIGTYATGSTFTLYGIAAA